jgi:hypothetical protein
MPMRAALRSSAIVLVLAAGPAAAADCQLGEAVYDPIDGDGAVIRFVPVEHGMYADYAMRLEFPKTGRIDAFEFTSSNGYSRHYAILKVEGGSGEDAAPGDAPSSTIQMFDEDLKGIESMSIGGPAPDLIILPDLAVELWYGRADGDRDNIPPEGLWRARCP